jgi:hypothetical protein
MVELSSKEDADRLAEELKKEFGEQVLLAP